MAYKSEPRRVSEAKKIAVALPDIESYLSEDLTTANLTGIISDIEAGSAEIKKLKDNLAAAVDAKKKKLVELRVFMKRLRSGAKSAFGDDSLEYESVGGTRRSEYKSRTKSEAAIAS